MIKNYFKIAWRNILKNRGIFSLNIAGLAIGMASCLMIMLFVIDELSYDRYNEKADQIVRVVFRAEINGEQILEPVVMAPVAGTFKNEIPEVLDATRIRTIGTPRVTYNNNAYRNGRFAYVDPNFFRIFTLRIVAGDKEAPLEEPNSIVLTRKEAQKFFGDEDPVGKTLLMGDANKPFKVTALIDEVPENSHFHFDLFASTNGYEPAKGTSWINSNYYTYLLLKEGTDPKVVEAKLPPIVERHMGPQMKEAIGLDFSKFDRETHLGLFLQPLTDIHLNPEFSAGSSIEKGGDIKYVYIFSAIALFMLLIACINFMNLSTAAASKRAREIGIRKVLGSRKKQLIYQFLAESFIATLIAACLAAALFSIALPVFNDLSGKELQPDYLLRPATGVAIAFLIVCISIFAGGYPAFFLSSFPPLAALKNRFSGLQNSKMVRSGLVIFQFVISSGLILATLVVSRQMNFIQNKNLGYEKDQLLVLRESYFLGNNETAFKNEILNDPRVANVSQSAFVPAGASDNTMTSVYLGDEFQRRMFVYKIDEEYIPTMEMELVQGRNFSREFGSDSTTVIINERAARIFEFGEDAIGKTIFIDTEEDRQELTVVGVIRDFHFKSLHQEIDPLLMLNHPTSGMVIKAKGADMAGLVEHLNNLWIAYNVQESFSYTLLDDSYNKIYLPEQKMGTILNLFAILTIVVACLGLFGLVTYTAEQRYKEIGVRKVLGSSVTQIVGLLSRDFLRLVLLSFVIAFPLGFHIMEKWLQDFAYRITIDSWIFLATAALTLLIAFLTVCFKSIKAALQNPVKSLRTE